MAFIDQIDWSKLGRGAEERPEMAIKSPKLASDVVTNAPSEGFDAMGIPILRDMPEDWPTLVPDNPWREARDERKWVHLLWSPQILAQLVNSKGRILGKATYEYMDGRDAVQTRAWPRDVQYMATWYDMSTDLIVQRYCHPDFYNVQEGAKIPVVKVMFDVAEPKDVVTTTL